MSEADARRTCGDGGAGPGSAAPEILRARVLAAVAGTPAPTRPDGRRRGRALLLVSILVAVAIFEGAGGLSHSAGRPLTISEAMAGGWGIVSALLSGLVFWRRRSTLGRPPAILMLAALATPLLLLGWLHHFNGTYDEPFSRPGLRCLAYTLAMSALPLGSFLALRRGIEPRGPWALGAAVGATCGAWASLLVDLWCPLTNTPHILVGHVLPVALLVALGTLLGRSWLGVQRLPASGDGLREDVAPIRRG